VIGDCWAYVVVESRSRRRARERWLMLHYKPGRWRRLLVAFFLDETKNGRSLRSE